MSLIYLYASATELYRNSYASFTNDTDSIIINLEQQMVISLEWLSKTENQKNYIISLPDAGVPTIYDELKNRSADGRPSERKLLIVDTLAYFNETDGMYTNEMATSFSPYYTYNTKFKFTSPSNGNDYYGCVAVLGRDNGKLQLVVIGTLDTIRSQIIQQRIFFLTVNLASILALAVFSWFFTLKLLKPVEESRKRQAQFVASASHELRTPLAVILSCLAALGTVFKNNNTATEAHLQPFLQTIESESKRMSGLLDDMLVLSRADNHTWNMQMEKIQCDTLLLNAYETFETMAQEKGLHYTIMLPEQSASVIYGDEARLTQILAILIHNAISYTPKGGSVSLSLTIYKKKTGFLITDTGPGIAEEEKNRIFDRFYRIDQARNIKEHSGLGLSIAYEIAVAHNGEITVKDQPGGGSAFEAVFPVCYLSESQENNLQFICDTIAGHSRQ